MSVGSLTTTFTPPTSCLASFSTTAWSSAGFYFAGPFLTTSGCMPTNFQFSSTNYYSPGICPVGYTTACSSLIALGTLSETVVTCCPTSYACNTYALYPWQYTFGCQSTFNTIEPFSSILVFSGTVPLSTGPTSAYPGAVNALSVQIRYQSTDFQSSTSAPTPTPTSTTTAPSILSTGGAGGGGSHGISPGAAAGIGLGSAVVALCLAGAFVFVYTLGRRRRLAENTSASQGSTQKNTVPVYTNTPASQFLMAEMPTEQIRLPGLRGYPD